MCLFPSILVVDVLVLLPVPYLKLVIGSMYVRLLPSILLVDMLELAMDILSFQPCEYS